VRNPLYEKINTDAAVISHRLYDENGQLVAGNDAPLKIRGKIRCVGKDGSVLNCGNTTIYPGRRFVLEAIFRMVPNADQMITVNKALNINAIKTPANPEDYLKRAVCLVGVGDGGAGLTFGDVHPVHMNHNNLVAHRPLRTVPVGNDLTQEEKQTYYMRKRETVSGVQYYNYYLKKINTDQIFVMHEKVAYTPTTEANDPTLDKDSPLVLNNIQVYTVINIPITEKDIKEYYRAEYGNINLSRFNEMSLFFGLPVIIQDPDTSEDYTDYIVVEAFSKLSFNNRPMDEENSAFTFQYYLIT
jgi:hypothetical protein